MVTSNPVLYWERPPRRKHYNTFRELPPQLQTSMLEDSTRKQRTTLLTMYVGAASQHVLRISFVPEQETRNFDRQVTTFWSRCFFLLFKLGELGVGSAVQRHAAALWRAWQSIITTSMATTQSSSTQHHHYELNWHNSKPPFHYI